MSEPWMLLDRGARLRLFRGRKGRLESLYAGNLQRSDSRRMSIEDTAEVTSVQPAEVIEEPVFSPAADDSARRVAVRRRG